MNFDAVIIGGGIVGTACAMKLSEVGLSVAIVERDFIASGSTASGMGHIVVMDDSDDQFELTRLSRELWSEIAAALPKTCEYENCGTIWVAADDEELTEASRKQKYYAEYAVSSRIIDNGELYKLEPNLRHGLAGGLLVEGDSVVYQLSASRYFAETARENGTAFIGSGALEIDGSRVILESGETVTAGNIINAAGIRAPKLSPELKIESKKGQLVITDRYPGFVSHQIVELGYLKSAHSETGESVAFNVQPRATGQLLIGSSRQPGVENKEIDRGMLKRMLARAFEYMPGLRVMSAIRTWTGNRPATPDNLPCIGRSTTNKNVVVAAGHEGLGITTSLGTAELVADIILERESRISREAYSAARFTA